MMDLVAKRLSADSSIPKLKSLDVSKCKNVAELLATELTAWNACLRELDEPPMANYLRWGNLKAACAKDQHLQPMIEDFTDLTTREKKFKLSKSWNQIETKLRDGREMAQGNGKMQLIDIEDDSSMTDSKSDNENHDDETLSTHTLP